MTAQTEAEAMQTEAAQAEVSGPETLLFIAEQLKNSEYGFKAPAFKVVTRLTDKRLNVEVRDEAGMRLRVFFNAPHDHQMALYQNAEAKAHPRGGLPFLEKVKAGVLNQLGVHLNPTFYGANVAIDEVAKHDSLNSDIARVRLQQLRRVPKPQRFVQKAQMMLWLESALREIAADETTVGAA